MEGSTTEGCNKDFGRIRLTIGVDLEKLAGIPGLTFRVSAVNQAGPDIANTVGTFTNPAGTDRSGVQPHPPKRGVPEQSIIETKIVLLISLLALARKFIILDLKETTPNELLGLAAVTLAPGVTYWLLRERDDRLGLQTKAQPEKASASKPSRSSRPPTH